MIRTEMDVQRSLRGRGQKFPWPRHCVIAIAVVSLSFVLVVSFGPFYVRDRSWTRQGRHDHVRSLKGNQRGLGKSTGTSYRANGLHISRNMLEGQRQELSGDNTPGGGVLLKRYSSFAKYALETNGSSEALPLPLVVPIGNRALVSIPILTIIGVQKGGTTNLRSNLLTHPSVSGMHNEVHFFDRHPEKYPKLGRWPGDGLEKDLAPGVVGRVLSEYAKACLEEGKPRKRKNKKPALGNGGVIVESSPRYILSPLAPYRMKMVRPQAKLVVVLRDPTDRYFSQLRMLMCKKEADPGFASPEEMISTFFHPPGGAKGYLERGAASYTPYTALCRGENATSADLWQCYKSMEGHNPLHRGLYADQLERWFRVFDRSQIMVVDSEEMFAEFTGTVSGVATFAGLPPHDFEYNPKHEFRGVCTKQRHRHDPDFFAEGGRYEVMLEEGDLIREWYRPHNERLFALLGRDMGWK